MKDRTGRNVLHAPRRAGLSIVFPSADDPVLYAGVTTQMQEEAARKIGGFMAQF